MPTTARMTSQRCSMQKRMMRSNMVAHPASVPVVGAGFAELRLQHERIGGRVLLVRLDAFENLDRLSIGASHLDGASDEPAGHCHEDHRLVVDGLHSLRPYRHRHILVLAEHRYRHEETWPPSSLRVRQRHPRTSGA